MLLEKMTHLGFPLIPRVATHGAEFDAKGGVDISVDDAVRLRAEILAGASRPFPVGDVETRKYLDETWQRTRRLEESRDPKPHETDEPRELLCGCNCDTPVVAPPFDVDCIVVPPPRWAALISIVLRLG